MKLTQNLLRTLMFAGLATTLALAQSTGSQSGTNSGTTTTTDQTTPTTGQTSTEQSTGASPTTGGTAGAGTMDHSTTRGTSKGAASHDGHMSGAGGSSDQSMVGKMDRDFMMHAAMGGMAEVQLAQMAQQKGQSQEVKDYARKLEQDHTQANDKLKAIAQERQVSLPSDMGPEHKTMVTKLNNLSGAEFDKAYVKMMVADHKKDVKEFERASTRSMDSDLKNFAAATTPTLKEHLTAAQQLQSGSSRSRTSDTGKASTRSESTSSNSTDSKSDTTTSSKPDSK